MQIYPKAAKNINHTYTITPIETRYFLALLVVVKVNDWKAPDMQMKARLVIHQEFE
jgi:hypothetical protein